MSQFQFPCPKCQQPVLCDEQYRGMDLSCPHCNAVITAPPPAGAPLGKPGPKVSTSTLTQSHEAPKPTVPLPPPYVPRIKKGSPKWVTPVVVVVVIAVIAGFLYENPSYVESAKTKLGFAPTMKPATTNAAPADVAADTNAPPVVTNAPPRAFWSLDLATNSFPAYIAKGTIKGTEFLVDGARIDGTVLSLIQGSGGPPQREFIIYLSLRPGEVLDGLSVEVVPDQKTGVPRVLQRWGVDGKPGLQQKLYTSGYAMKLQLGALNNGQLPGKIYLSVPDDEQSFVAGTFSAGVKKVTAQPTGNNPAPATPPPGGRRRRPGDRPDRGPNQPGTAPRMPRPTTGGGTMIPL